MQRSFQLSKRETTHTSFQYLSIRACRKYPVKKIHFETFFKILQIMSRINLLETDCSHLADKGFFTYLAVGIYSIVFEKYLIGNLAGNAYSKT